MELLGLSKSQLRKTVFYRRGKNMISANNSTMDDASQHSDAPYGRRSRGGCCTRGNWSGLNIAAMVLGFVFFWPLGLAVLFWNISGRSVKDIPQAVQSKWSSTFGGSFSRGRHHGSADSENSVFDEFQQTQYDRISEIKEEIKNRARSFTDFRSNARRRAEEKEFRDFMAGNPVREDD
jgi:hypothetical protein